MLKQLDHFASLNHHSYIAADPTLAEFDHAAHAGRPKMLNSVYHNDTPIYSPGINLQNRCQILCLKSILALQELKYL